MKLWGSKRCVRCGGTGIIYPVTLCPDCQPLGQRLVSEHLSTRIAALEASQCQCRDCETHREKAAASSRANVAAEARRVGT